MTYASVDAVQALIPHIQLTATSRPTLTQVQGFLDRLSAEVDGALASRGITVPITTPAYFLTSIDNLVSMGAAGQALMAALPGQGGPTTGGQGREYWNHYVEMLKAYRRGEGIPTEVEVEIITTEAGTPRSYFTDIGAVGATAPVQDEWGEFVTGEGRFPPGKVF